jgi:hypothetical protein
VERVVARSDFHADAAFGDGFVERVDEVRDVVVGAEGGGGTLCREMCVCVCVCM